MRAYDKRQYDRLAQRIALFEAEEIGVNRLIIDAKALLTCLRHVPKEWHKAFEVECGRLDTIHAVVLDRSQGVYSEEDKEALRGVIRNMKNLLAQVA